MPRALAGSDLRSAPPGFMGRVHGPGVAQARAHQGPGLDAGAKRELELLYMFVMYLFLAEEITCVVKDCIPWLLFTRQNIWEPLAAYDDGINAVYGKDATQVPPSPARPPLLALLGADAAPSTAHPASASAAEPFPRVGAAARVQDTTRGGGGLAHRSS